MTEVLIGNDSTGVACVKITKGTYDPITTSDALRERFYFNSKWKDQVDTPDIEQCTQVGGSSEGGDRQPSGASSSSFTRARYWYGTAAGRMTFYWFAKARFPGLRYNVPIIDLKHRAANGRFQQGKQVRKERGFANDFGVYGGRIEFDRPRGEWFTGYNYDIDGASYDVNQASCSGPIDIGGSSADTVFAVVWNLPGNNVDLDGPSSPPSPSGKETVLITSTQCRVAKPGYDVNSATPEQLAFDSTGRPLNVIAAADIAVPAGASSYDTGIDLPDAVVAEVCFYTGSTLYYPSIPRDSDGLGAEYWFDGTRIRFNNDGVACRARFIIFGVDPLGPSSGANDVLRPFTDGGENHVQFLRPGASATPRFSDIVIDSRRPVIQILADGYVGVPVADGHSQTISFDAAGFFPLVKFVTVHGSGGDGLSTWSTRSRAPVVKRLLPQIVSGQNQNAGDSAHCTYTATGATFFTNRGKPVDRYYTSLGELVTVADSNPIVGIRWFVLGIPLP